MINANIANSMLQEFDGCDSDNPGNSEYPAVWLFGIEHGSLPVRNGESVATPTHDMQMGNNYSIETQLTYRPYNQRAFKLLAAMNGNPVSNFREFAHEYQPFVRGLNDEFKEKLYFKGNLYPYACHDVNEWSDDVKSQVGLTKNEYRQWCKEHRFPIIKQWVDKYQPKLFIGVGITCRNEFSLAVFGKEVDLNQKIITVNGRDKKIYYFVDGIRKLVVVPHFVGRHGLNSDKSLQETGEFIAGL
jgi:hypothetical protein